MEPKEKTQPARPVNAENTRPEGGEPIARNQTPHIQENPDNKKNPKPPRHEEASDEVPS